MDWQPLTWGCSPAFSGHQSACHFSVPEGGEVMKTYLLFKTDALLLYTFLWSMRTGTNLKSYQETTQKLSHVEKKYLPGT
jgi:hypothetical protein